MSNTASTKTEAAPTTEKAAQTSSPSTVVTPAAQTKTTEFKFDAKVLQDRLEKIIGYQNTFAGKRNHNPFMWIKHNVTPLYNRLLGISKSGEKIQPEASKELHDLIMKLPLECPPIVDSNIDKKPADHIRPAKT